ncbi:MAG: Asp-tRNA(Asn)/Glu-tRNA(Gln) amidotransferase subunit GatC [Candidatus Aenigmarchaeota archaeon]|nr:Asp-tRNA(Asn)/Glu-tRNA(Gln) amidotransferase subunit GatC [Candidatus Aenigmarchaeota archaeon]
MAATITAETVRHVAALARLELTDAEVTRFQAELNDILRAFKVLDTCRTGNVKPSFQPIEAKNVMHADVPEPCLTQEDSLRNTRHKEHGFFKGPRAV